MLMCYLEVSSESPHKGASTAKGKQNKRKKGQHNTLLYKVFLININELIDIHTALYDLSEGYSMFCGHVVDDHVFKTFTVKLYISVYSMHPLIDNHGKRVMSCQHWLFIRLVDYAVTCHFRISPNFQTKLHNTSG